MDHSVLDVLGVVVRGMNDANRSVHCVVHVPTGVRTGGFVQEKPMKCKQCGNEFEGRADAKYCSAKCRVAANRNTTEPIAVTESTAVVTDAVLEQLTPEVITALPVGVSRPTGKRTEATAGLSNEAILDRLLPMRDWVGSPEYAERIYSLVKGLCSVNRPSWAEHLAGPVN